MADKESANPKPLYWAGSSKRDLLTLPDPVVDFFGYALLGNLYGMIRAADSSQGSTSMTLDTRLSLVAAYVAFAFVGAIVLGVF